MNECIMCYGTNRWTWWKLLIRVCVTCRDDCSDLPSRPIYRYAISDAEMDTDRVGSGHGSDSRIWVGLRVRPTFYRIFLCFIFHRFYSYCCRPEQHRPVCSSRADTGNQLWLQVILWVGLVLRRDSGQQETEGRQLVAPSRRRHSLHEISHSRSLQR